MAGFIAMTSVMVVVGIEMFFATRGAGHVHGSDYDTLPLDEGANDTRHKMNGGTGRPMKPFRQEYLGMGDANDINLGEVNLSEPLMEGRTPSILTASPMPNNSHKFQEGVGEESDLDLDELDTAASNLLNVRGRPSGRDSMDDSARHHTSLTPNRSNSDMGGSQAQLSEEQQQRKMLLQCLLLEAGILFHSVFIGMALSVATGTSFMVLLVAISFHREW
jgi:hypothetical protein